MGMRQRLAIAARAARRPAGPDPRRADQRARPAGHQLAARPAARRRRRAAPPCSISSHVLAEVALSVDDVVVIAGGELRAQGTLEQVLGGDDGPATEVRAQDPERLIAALESRGHDVQRAGDVLSVMGAIARAGRRDRRRGGRGRPGPRRQGTVPGRRILRADWSHVMNALLKAELLKLRTTRTFAAVVGVVRAVLDGARRPRRRRRDEHHARTPCSPTTRSPT